MAAVQFEILPAECYQSTLEERHRIREQMKTKTASLQDMFKILHFDYQNLQEDELLKDSTEACILAHKLKAFEQLYLLCDHSPHMAQAERLQQMQQCVMELGEQDTYVYSSR